MECLTDKLDGKFPIGKTNIVGSQVIPVAYTTTPGGSSPAPQAPVEMDPMKFLTAFDYGNVTTLPDGRTQREYHIWAEDKELEVAAGDQVSGLGLQRLHARADPACYRRRPPPDSF